MTVTRRTGTPAYTGTNTGPTNYWVQAPSTAVAGDLLHAVVRLMGNAAGGIPTLPGWTVQTILNVATLSGQLRVISARRVCQTGDPGTVFTSNAYASAAVGDFDAACSAYLGVDTVSPVAFVGGGNGTFAGYSTAPAVPASRTGSLALDELMIDSSFPAVTAPTGDTLAYDSTSSFGRHAGAIVAAGTSGLSARTWGISDNGAQAYWTAATVVLQPPDSAPAVPGAFTSPTAGQVTDASVSVAWGSSTDPDPGDTVTYSLDFTRDNGATWGSVATGLTSPAYTHNVTAVASSTACIYRVKAVDQLAAASAWRTSPTFIIDHNVAPTAATGLNPDGNPTLDRTSSNRLSWVFNDPNIGDGQTWADVRYRITGSSTWATVTNASTTNRWYDVAAFALAAGAYEWQVRTYDSQGVASPWSASAFFTMATPPAGPTSLVPTSGSTVPTSTGVLAWTVGTQTDYQVRKLADASGSPDTGTVYYDSGDVVSATARNAPLDYPVNSRYEHLQVRIKAGGLWSPWSSVRVLISYTPPAAPALTVTPVDSTGSLPGSTDALVVAVANPTPTGTEPTVTSWDLYRRTDSGDGIPVARAQVGDWTEYSPGSATDYQFRARVFGDNGTDTYSAWT